MLSRITVWKVFLFSKKSRVPFHSYRCLIFNVRRCRFLDSSKSISLSSAFVNTFLKLFLKIFSSIFFKLRRPLFRSWGFLSSFAYRILPFSFVFVNTFWQTFLYILHYQLSFGTLLRVFSCFVSLLTLYIVVAFFFLFFYLYVEGEWKSYSN